MTSAAMQIEPELGEFRLTVAGRECSVLCRRALVSWLDEQVFLSEDPKQYGVALWPASIALALEIGQRANEFRGRTVLELGAGVGLPGIAAAAVGARVVQTDRDDDALSLCRRNAERNRLEVVSRVADWAEWPAGDRYDWIIGSDILYRMSLHDQLRSIFETALPSSGKLLLSDPIRSSSLKLLERLEQEEWRVRMNRWSIGEGEDGRVIGVFEAWRNERRPVGPQ
jgi:predicted nicotinamide N-methyase